VLFFTAMTLISLSCLFGGTALFLYAAKEFQRERAFLKAMADMNDRAKPVLPKMVQNTYDCTMEPMPERVVKPVRLSPLTLDELSLSDGK
jgi:hypothetical protein